VRDEPLSPAALAWLEALLDDRLGVAPGDVPPDVLGELRLHGLPDPAARDRDLGLVRDAALGRRADWPRGVVTSREVLEAFARHCAEELDDVEVACQGATWLEARWRDEVSRIEARAGTVGIERLAGRVPTLVLAPLEDRGGALLERYLDDAALRGSLAVLDLDRLERLGAVRSSVFVYLDWFLREAYGVKVLPLGAFTEGLLVRGIISLGMG
jgi:hypothetical protein